jgi:hypothetical protein
MQLDDGGSAGSQTMDICHPEPPGEGIFIVPIEPSTGSLRILRLTPQDDNQVGTMKILRCAQDDNTARDDNRFKRL